MKGTEALSLYLVPTARLELAQLSPLPPQDSVSTNFTTSAAVKTRSGWHEELRTELKEILTSIPQRSGPFAAMQHCPERDLAYFVGMAAAPEAATAGAGAGTGAAGIGAVPGICAAP